LPFLFFILLFDDREDREEEEEDEVKWGRGRDNKSFEKLGC